MTARLCYRKFAWLNTQFAFAGEPATPEGSEPEAKVTPEFDDRKFVFTKSLQGISAKSEKIPDLPIVALANNEAVLSHSNRTPFSPNQREELAFNFCTTSARVNEVGKPMSK